MPLQNRNIDSMKPFADIAYAPAFALALANVRERASSAFSFLLFFPLALCLPAGLLEDLILDCQLLSMAADKDSC